MVRGEHDDRPPGEPQLLEARQQTAQLLIHIGEAAVVDVGRKRCERRRQGDLAIFLAGFKQHEVLDSLQCAPERRPPVRSPGDDGELQLGIVLAEAAEVGLSRAVGDVDLVGVEEQEETLLRDLRQPLQDPVDVGLELVAGVGLARVAIDVEALGEAESRMEQTAAGRRQRGIARLAEQLGQQHQLVGQGLFVVEAVPVRVETAEHRNMGRQRPGGRRHGVLEDHGGAPCPGIEVRRGRPRVAVERQPVGAQGIDRDQHDVPRCRSGPRAEDLRVGPERQARRRPGPLGDSRLEPQRHLLAAELGEVDHRPAPAARQPIAGAGVSRRRSDHLREDLAPALAAILDRHHEAYRHRRQGRIGELELGAARKLELPLDGVAGSREQGTAHLAADVDFQRPGRADRSGRRQGAGIADHLDELHRLRFLAQHQPEAADGSVPGRASEDREQIRPDPVRVEARRRISGHSLPP